MEGKELGLMLEEELARLIEELGNLEPGTEQYTETVKSIDSLYKNRLADLEVGNKIVQDDKNNRKDWAKIGVDAGKHVANGLLYTGLFFAGLKFEQTGTICSKFVSNLVNFIKPNK